MLEKSQIRLVLDDDSSLPYDRSGKKVVHRRGS